MQVIIVAPNAPTAVRIRKALLYAPTCRVIGWVNERYPCAAAVAAQQPDLIVVDAGNGSNPAYLDRVREARQESPGAKIVALYDHVDPQVFLDARPAGIDAAVDKSGDAATVGLLIREVARGTVLNAAPQPTAKPVPKELGDLTARELEILRMVAAGMPNGRIAASLWVAEQTVKFHLSNVYRKLGLANRTEAASYAHRHGLVETTVPPPAALTTAA